MIELSDSDRALIDALRIDHDMRPGFEEIRYCLIWRDEYSEEISARGYDFIGNLWIARGCIHRGLPVEEWGALGGEVYLEYWDHALRTGLRWPGFHRIALRRREQEYLHAMLLDDS